MERTTSIQNLECDKWERCDGRCPENCICPWAKEAEEADKNFAFEYWASEQNRCEDPDGYKEFCEYCKDGLYN